MPYIKAEEGQLFIERIYTNPITTTIIYNQRINGYYVYRSGRLVIEYNFSTSEFIITDNTREISSEYVPINITEDEAIEIVLKHYGAKEKVIRTHQYAGLSYYTVNTETGLRDYRLCYRVYYGDYCNYVSPVTGKILLKEEPLVRN